MALAGREVVGMAQEKAVRAFVSRIVKGYRAFLRNGDVFPNEPWAHAYDLAGSLYYGANIYIDSNYETELISALRR
jgi:hypothetical protein